ncbi:MAG TPA: MFS transporter [Vicinamibacterales bacterium]|jgi:MFS family permease|nr:MFS transporter [Vicinamibacterales bacterium]
MRLSVAYGSFASRNYRFLLAGTTLSNLAAQMLGVVVGWDLYVATRSPLVLGNVGLVQIIPVFLFTFVAGHLADRHDRRVIAVSTQIVVAILGFALAAAGARRGVGAIYTALFLSASARAFQWPANSALLPQTVPPALLTNAVSWSGTGREFATVGGPAVGGALLAAFGSESVYLVQAALSVAAVLCFAGLRVPRPEGATTAAGWRTTLEGLRFVWRDKLILSALSLDLLAVFFGGAVALLPIFAADILHVGASGLGWLRAAPAIGAGLMSVWLAHHAVTRHGGLVLLGSVAMFGVATVGFGLATAAWLSFFMLFLTGVFDAVSVVLRISLVQMRTPDALRGRVAAVNALFISCSNQWGAVESGVAAQWFGTVPSVVIGGAATLAVVVVIGLLSKRLREWQHG